MDEKKTNSQRKNLNKEKEANLVKEKRPIPPKVILPPRSSANPVIKPLPCTCVNGVVLKKYIGKKVNVLLNDIKMPYDSYTYSQEPPSILNSCLFIFDSQDSVVVKVYVDRNKLKYLKSYNRKGDWNIELFKKEKIYDISCEYCINGCR